MADAPDVGKPASGSYGEGADLQRLKQQLPQGAIGNPPPAPAATPLPPVSAKPMVKPTRPVGRPPTGAAAPPGIPSAILHPGDIAAPAAAPPAPGSQVSPDQARLFLLQNLAQSPQVSSTTRAWAQEVLQILQGGQGQAMTPPAGAPAPAPAAAPAPAPAPPAGVPVGR